MAIHPNKLPTYIPIPGYSIAKYFYTRWYYKKADAQSQPAPDVPEIVGVKDASYARKSDNASAGWTVTLDTTTRPGHVKILVNNGSGDADILLGFTVRGKAVKRLSGNLGYKHDSHNDYDDIAKNGEHTFEFGNNFVCTKTQLEQLADYYWKLMRKKKHLYLIALSGVRYWFEPGEWYTLEVGGAGQVEYIDATVECYDVQTERGAGDVGQTIIAFREVEQNWTFDSNAAARFIACGSPQAIPKTEGVVSVASANYLGAADYYCDGTSDEDEINAAITAVSDKYGNGEIRLLGDAFYIDGVIAPKSGMYLNLNGCTIEKNSSDSGIYADGSAGTYTDIIIANGRLTRNASDSTLYLSQFTNGSGGSLSNIKFYDLYFDSGGAGSCIDVSGIDGGMISGCTMTSGNYGIYESSCTAFEVTNCYIFGNNYGMGYESGLMISSCRIFNNRYAGIFTISDGADDASIKANNIYNNGDVRASAALYGGIYIVSGANYNFVSGNRSEENGNLISYSDCENATPPQTDGNVASNTTASRSSTEAYEGTYSYKINKDNAAGTAAHYYLTDNADPGDMHGFVAGVTYKMTMRVFIPSSGMTGTEMLIGLSDGVLLSTQAAANTYDEWQEVTLTKTLDAGATRAWCRVSFESTAAEDEFFYIDNVRIVPLGLGNDHDTNFSDSGTGTVVSGNSWQ